MNGDVRVSAREGKSHVPMPVPATASDEFANRLRSAIGDRGLSLERLRYHLSQHGHDLSVATLSYWQSGRSRPDRATSLASLGTLEEVLGLAPGELASTLPPRRRRSVSLRQRVEHLAPLTTDGQIMDGLARQLGLQWNSGLRRVCVHDQIGIDANRTYAQHVVREIMLAEVDGVDRWPVWYQHDDKSVMPRIEPIKDCRLGRVIEVPDRQLLVAEMLAPRPLRLGEALLIEYALSASGDHGPMTWWERGSIIRLRELHLEVRFAQSTLPVSAEAYTIVDGVRRNDPLLITANTLRSLRLDFGPGMSGASWTW